MINMSIEEKIERLEDLLRNKKCVLGFSAGSDSTLLAFILSRVSPDSLLATIDNNMMPPEFIEYTSKQAKKFKLKHEVIKVDYYQDPTFINNGKERCYECRKTMYSSIQQLPEFNEYDYFLEGTNITDLLENRPGILVREMFNMTSPLVECNITKADVYEMIDYFNLEYSKDTTCLATRVKTDQKVNSNRLDLIYNAEKLVKSKLKQSNIRVRFDDYTAIIAVDNPLELLDEKLIIELRDKLQELGFNKVFLDITGYEKTKLEESIDEEGNYYYQLPYTINLEKTRNNIKNSKILTKTLKLDDNLTYDDIIIEENGKISMHPTENFVEKFNEIIGFVERKKI